MEEYLREKTQRKPKPVHAYIIADASTYYHELFINIMRQVFENLAAVFRPSLTHTAFGFCQSKADVSDGIRLVFLLTSLWSIFLSCVLFPEAVGGREYCCMAVEDRLKALRVARSPRETRSSPVTNPRPSRLGKLG